MDDIEWVDAEIDEIDSIAKNDAEFLMLLQAAIHDFEGTDRANMMLAIRQQMIGELRGSVTLRDDLRRIRAACTTPLTIRTVQAVLDAVGLGPEGN